MGAWTFREPISGLEVDVKFVGEPTLTSEYETTVAYARRGSSPWVVESPRRHTTPDIGELVFRHEGNYSTFRAIRNLSRRTLLTDDNGTTYAIRFVGPLTCRIADTPDRHKRPLRFVTVQMVGVD